MTARGRALLLVGPTAVGKSALALSLAEILGGEIVSLDSRQMVRGLDIGTAKPTPAERARVTHHLVDVAAPDEPLPLSRVLEQVYAAVDGALARGRAPVLVGGTGQYVRAVREGWVLPDVPPDADLRADLAAFATEQGAAALHARLAAADPAAAARIDPRNVRRVIRAIEILAHTGQPPSVSQRRAGGRYDLLVVGLSRSRPGLYARVDARIDAMIAAGLEGEVRGLVAAGHGWHLPALSSVGYGEWRGLFDGQVDRDEVVRLIRHNTRRLVRNQGAWFRADDPGITWVDLEQPAAAETVWALARGWFGATPGAIDRATATEAPLARGDGLPGAAIMAGDDPRSD